MGNSDMDLEAEELRLIDLLGERTRIFRVPIFQREYKWKQKQRSELWDDIETIGTEAKPSHFVGQVILVEDERKSDEDVDTYKIVDGQQRLTTFSILVCAIRDAADLHDNKNVESILTTHDKNGDEIRTLHLLDGDEEAYQHLYDGSPELIEEDHRIREAYDFFKQKLSDLDTDEQIDLLKNVVNNVDLVRTSCGSMTAAYQVFQTQNDRGLALSPLNLAKTKLLEEASLVGLNEESVRRRWENISTRLEENDQVSSAAPRRAFTHYLIVDEEYDVRSRVTTKDFYRTFAAALDKHEGATEIRRFISKLEDYTDRYIDIHEGTVRKYQRNKRSLINDQMRFFQSKNSHAPVVLLYLVENIDTADEMENLLRLANKLNVRLNLQDAAPAYHRDSMYQLVTKLIDSKQSQWEDEAEDLIKERTVSDKQLKEILKGRELPNSRFTRFLLRALEEDYYNAGSRETRIDLDQVDLEHIAPLSSLSSERYSTWAAVFNHNEERFDHYKSRLGNLTLLADRQNSRVRNGSYAEKCAEYEQSDITMTQRIPDNYPSWGFETIEDRTRTIAQDIVNLWGV